MPDIKEGRESWRYNVAEDSARCPYVSLGGATLRCSLRDGHPDTVEHVADPDEPALSGWTLGQEAARAVIRELETWRAREERWACSFCGKVVPCPKTSTIRVPCACGGSLIPLVVLETQRDEKFRVAVANVAGVHPTASREQILQRLWDITGALGTARKSENKLANVVQEEQKRIRQALAALDQVREVLLRRQAADPQAKAADPQAKAEVPATASAELPMRGCY